MKSSRVLNCKDKSGVFNMESCLFLTALEGRHMNEAFSITFGFKLFAIINKKI
jgi:hypothetical protein